MNKIITREVTFKELTDQERDLMAQGFQMHMENEGIMEGRSVRDCYELLEVANPVITFYRKPGNDNEYFEFDVSKNQFLENLMHRELDRVKKINDGPFKKRSDS